MMSCTAGHPCALLCNAMPYDNKPCSYTGEEQFHMNPRLDDCAV